jgi:hypothetical protein
VKAARPAGRHLTPEEYVALDAALRSEPNPTAAARKVGCHGQTARKRARELNLPFGRRRPVAAAPAAAAAEAQADPVDLARLRKRVTELGRQLDDMTARTARAEDLRAGVFGLVGEPLAPTRFPAAAGGDAPASAETIVLFLSDLHWGERVDLAAMDGLNSFDLAIARRRLARWVRAVVDLATRHWSGPPPARLMLILGGDLVSGEIHAELAKTNEAKALPAVRDLAEHLIGAVETFLDALPCPVDVISLAGNHGRSTIKPESKEAVSTSYDTLVSHFVELGLRGRERVRFYVPPSVDAQFSVYGWRVMATHGDRIGSRGGQGFIGPAATAARGMKRIVADYAARGVHLDLILIGHFHTRLQLEEGFVNGSLPGPTEYSRDGRFRPHPAQQLFLTIHPRRLIAQVRWIEVGAPEEGALYQPPPEDRPLRPRYRIPALGTPA